MFKRLVFAACLVLPAAAMAQDDPVKARMALMKAVGSNLKVIGDMAKGSAAFDADKANEALANIAARAAEAPAAFETEATNADSEALPAIWQNWDDFVAKAGALETAASDASVEWEPDLATVMQSLGGTCRACHQTYRE